MTHIEYLLFDLDDTLYTNASGLFGEIAVLIEEWLARELALSPEEAYQLHKRYFCDYGTTMAGILRHHPELDIDDYLEYVHDVDLNPYLAAEERLDAMLTRLPVTKIIFTNAIASWAERVLRALGVREHFDLIIDVRSVDYKGKPRSEAYEMTLDLLGVPGTDCILIDDQARNLKIASDYGMRTILVRPGGEAGAGVDVAVDSIFEIEPPIQRWLDL
ncbi:MAG: pyrimidine 5'-nucleotidase [Anaerolineae bacterium]